MVIPLPSAYSLPSNSLGVLMDQFVNRLFLISGKFDNPTADNIVFLGPRVRDGQVGYHVVQPLIRDNEGGRILVDRGFVPKDKILNNQDDAIRWRLMDVSAAEASRRYSVDIS